MIRLMVLSLGLVLGLAAALIVEGRMAHLRALAGGHLPGWSAQVAEDAGVLRGHTGPLTALAGAEVAWRFLRMDRNGPVWRVTLSGPGIGIEGDLRPGRAAPARLTGLRGRIEPDAMAIWTEQPGVRGVLHITRGEALFEPASGSLTGFEAEGLIADTMLDGRATGDGRFRATLQPDGRLQIGATLSGSETEMEVNADALGGILRVSVPAQSVDLLPPSWGPPQAISSDRVEASLELPLRR